LPVVSLGNDTNICEGETLTLNAGSFDQYLWNDTSSNSTLDVTTSGEYYVQVTDNNKCSNTDTILVSFVICLDINDFGTQCNISVYPNPANDFVTVLSDNIIINNIEILSLTGKTLKKIITNNSIAHIDISNLNSGVYFLKINTAEFNKIIKIVKQ